MDKLEKSARAANLISLFFCLIVISIDYVRIITIFIIVLAILQTIHIIFGDVTDSYRLLRKKRFLRLYTISLAIFSFLDLLILFIINFSLNTKIYFFSILLSFLADFIANKLRVRRLDYKEFVFKNKKKKKINKK